MRASEPGPPEAGPVTRKDRAGALLQATRPRQWLKNMLVFAAPAAAGTILHLGPFLRTVAAFWIFVAASACTYLVNDVVDAESDRLHPIKRMRPVASGQLEARAALAAALVLGAAAVAGAAAIGLTMAAVVLAYLAISLAYTLRLKHVPLVELACVGSGFTLRAIGGGAAAHVLISPWFLVMTSFGALLIVAGKRTSEQAVLGNEQAAHRVALEAYPPGFLRGVRVMAMTVTVTTYCLWAFERASALRPLHHSEDLVWFELSIIPFVLAVLAIELAISRGRGGEPEDLALSDHLLQFFGLAWVVLVLCGIYA
jgi:decaprenyl-phosphate phosphoribosyltransferase